MTAKEAYEIVKKRGREKRYTSFNELDNYFIFCLGDSGYWDGVEKNTGEVTEMDYMEMILEQMWDEETQSYENDCDDEFFHRFAESIKSSKPITELE